MGLSPAFLDRWPLYLPVAILYLNFLLGALNRISKIRESETDENKFGEALYQKFSRFGDPRELITSALSLDLGALMYRPVYSPNSDFNLRIHLTLLIVLFALHITLYMFVSYKVLSISKKYVLSTVLSRFFLGFMAVLTNGITVVWFVSGVGGF